MRHSFILWSILAVLDLGLGYDGGGPLTPPEGEAYIAILGQRGVDRVRLEKLREFLANEASIGLGALPQLMLRGRRP